MKIPKLLYCPQVADPYLFWPYSRGCYFLRKRRPDLAFGMCGDTPCFYRFLAALMLGEEVEVDVVQFSIPLVEVTYRLTSQAEKYGKYAALLYLLAERGSGKKEKMALELLPKFYNAYVRSLKRLNVKIKNLPQRGVRVLLKNVNGGAPTDLPLPSRGDLTYVEKLIENIIAKI